MFFISSAYISTARDNCSIRRDVVPDDLMFIATCVSGEKYEVIRPHRDVRGRVKP